MRGFDFETFIRGSEVRFLMGTQNFFFVPRSWQDEKKNIFLYLSPNQLDDLLMLTDNFIICLNFWLRIGEFCFREEFFLGFVNTTSEFIWKRDFDFPAWSSYYKHQYHPFMLTTKHGVAFFIKTLPIMDNHRDARVAFQRGRNKLCS